MDIRVLVDETLGEATGRLRRVDDALPGTGGPAGNARLTAWTGLVLAVLFGAELITLLDVRGLMSWHVALGVLLIPPALVKTGSTGWRILRYYTGNRAYRRAGPPTLVLRVLGPVVVLSTLAVVASGVALAVMGTQNARRSLVDVLGHTVTASMLHKAAFVVWGIATGAHVLGRAIPALQLTVLAQARRRWVAGGLARAGIVAATVLAGGAAAVLALAVTDVAGWRAQSRDHEPRAHAMAQPAAATVQ